MEYRQDMETPIADEVLQDDAQTAPQMSFGWTFEPLPLAEARRLAHASRMDEAEYSMLREQSATSGKAGGLKKVEPLKAVDVVNRSKRFGCEPPTGGPAYHRSS